MVTPEDWWPELSGEDLETTESPYNTYQNDGLPPGPIANPGFTSIQAVLFPDYTPYMFFVAQCETGEHAFGVTPEDQAANVEQYQNNPTKPRQPSPWKLLRPFANSKRLIRQKKPLPRRMIPSESN